MATKVFISYRRDDSRYQARMIHAAFCKTLPSDHVFIDVDSIALGANFQKILKDSVDQCEVLLALIGPGWIDAGDPKTKGRRLDNPSDFVRIEIGEALARDIPVVPVLLDGTHMPDVALLPDDLKELVDRQAEFVEYRTFDDDVKRLIRKLRLLEEEARQRAEEERRRQEAEDRRRLDEAEAEKRRLEEAEAEARWRDEDERRRQEAEIKQRADEAESKARRRDEDERRRQEKLHEEAQQRVEEDRRREEAAKKRCLNEAEVEKRREDDKRRRQAQAPVGETKKVALLQINSAKGNALKFAIFIALLAVAGASIVGIALYSLNQVSENTPEALPPQYSAPAKLSAQQPANLSAPAPAKLSPLAAYEEAAAKGDASAMVNLGNFYEKGVGVPQDYAKAREWYEKAAAKGDTLAMIGLGLLYGQAQDYAKAREWYEQAAAKDNAMAMRNLGMLYEFGWGVPQDYAKAREWYEKAAAKGDASAKRYLEQLPTEQQAGGKR